MQVYVVIAIVRHTGGKHERACIGAGYCTYSNQ